MEIAWATTIGGRPANEDRFGVHKVSQFCSMIVVADGHGGSTVSTKIADCICELTMTTCKITIQSLGSCDIQTQQKEFLELFALIDEQSNSPLEGSTLCMALIFPSRVVVANCGDSHAIIVRKANGDLLLSTRPHNIEDPDEKSRMDAHDVTINPPYVTQRGFGLAMTRAIGDNHLSFVTHEPDVTCISHDRDIVVAIMSDGVTDFLNDESIINVILSSPYAKVVAETLLHPSVKSSMSGHISDNATCVCAFLCT